MKTNHRTDDSPFVEAAQRAVRAVGWDPREDLEVLPPDGSTATPTVRYGYRASRIRLVDSPNLPRDIGALREMTTQAGLGKPSDLLEDVVASRVYMLHGGWEICPYSADDYAEILEAVADGLRSAGISEPQVQEFVVPVTSFFVGSVISGTYAIAGPGPKRFRQGWHLGQIAQSRADGIKLSLCSSLYAAIQVRLWADNTVLTAFLRDCFAQPFDALDFETDRGVAILLDSFEFADSGRDGLAWLDAGTREQLLEELKYNYGDWPVKAFQYGELFAPYVGTNSQEQQPRDQQPPPSSPPRQGNRSQRPSLQAEPRRAAVSPPSRSLMESLRGQDRSSADRLPGAPIDFFANRLPGTPIDSFADRLATDIWFRQSVLQSGIGRGKGLLRCFPGFETLDVLYRSRSTEVYIESETTRKRGTSFPVAHLTRVELGTGMPGLNNIDWGATRFNRQHEPVLFQKTLPVTDDLPAGTDTGGCPDLLFVVDSSGSMSWEPEEGTGAYDSLLRAIYSVLQFLEQRNKAPYMRFAAVNFSAATLKTAWHDFHNIRPVKELLFKYQAGGTVLDCQALESIAAQSNDRFLCLMVTDGGLSNVAAAANSIRGMVSLGHAFVLIQIGRTNKMTEAVRQLGLPVHVITDHRQLEGLCLHYTKQTWEAGR